MKYTLTTLGILALMQLNAQPIIQDTSNIPQPGYTAQASIAIAATGTGNAGADQMWDFSSIDLDSMGMLTYVAPSATPFAASFPTANVAYSIDIGGGLKVYSYFQALDTTWNVLAHAIPAPGSDNDYSPNPRMTMKYPFQYNNSFSDQLGQ